MVVLPLPLLLLLVLLPQAAAPIPSATSRAARPASLRQARRRAGMPKSTRHARMALPAAVQRLPGRGGATMELVVVAVVAMVMVEVTEPVPEKVMLAGVKEKVGR